jgi:Asp-tRNA(Asn)/Glu-tRNA(Gln) amidotransferase B subunit
MKFVTIYGRDPKIIAKWISGPIAARTKENFKNIQELPFTNEQFGEFLGKAQAGSLMESQLKIIMDEMLNNHEE